MSFSFSFLFDSRSHSIHDKTSLISLVIVIRSVYLSLSVGTKCQFVHLSPFLCSFNSYLLKSY